MAIARCKTHSKIILRYLEVSNLPQSCYPQRPKKLNHYDNLGEIFSYSTLQLDTVDIKEVISTFYGRCYTVENVLQIEDVLFLNLNQSMKYKVFVHNKGEEIWITGLGYFPMKSIILTLGESTALCSTNVEKVDKIFLIGP